MEDGELQAPPALMSPLTYQLTGQAIHRKPTTLAGRVPFKQNVEKATPNRAGLPRDKSGLGAEIVVSLDAIENLIKRRIHLTKTKLVRITVLLD
jgi:hypothetical protein